MPSHPSTLTLGHRRRAFLQLGAAMGALWMAGPSGAQSTTPVKVSAVYGVPVEQSWASRVHAALRAAQQRGDIEYAYSENVAPNNYEGKLREHAQNGAELIIGEAFEDTTLVYRVARDYPKIAFLVGSFERPQQPNLAVFDSHIYEPLYLAGMIAGGVSKSGNIGVIAGHPIPRTNRLVHAFKDGVREVNPDAKFTTTFIESRFNPIASRQAAHRLIDQGVDVIYAERTGAVEAAQQRGVYVIGHAVDGQPYYPDTIITSAVWDVGPTLERALTMVRRGTFQADDYGKYSHMRYQGSALAPLRNFENKVPDALMARVRARQQTMLEGTFTIKLKDYRPQ
ncbi:BMP family ABC transporter substrate-binding protein [Bordetella sp. 15P40C-2]|nr:BMP family ABC transporter substrate-binding protein [Bordetella sp. 15P40C-2]